MTQDISGNMTQMLWQPRLLRLTYVAHPLLNGGKASTCFVAPQHIILIRLTNTKLDDDPNASFDSTLVVTDCKEFLHVTEAPDIVAMMRDRALGHEPTVSAV